ncbi:MAG: hypothetical protein ABSA51_12705 [Anaerolineaceae bacterium]|jgi:predicted esterase
MSASFRRIKPGFIVSVTLGVLLPLLGYGLIKFNDAYKPLWRLTGKLQDHGTYLLYKPDGLDENQPATLIFALSPTADAMSMISVWAKVADEHHWLLAASKDSRNGVEVSILFPEIEGELTDVEQNHKIDPRRVIMTGLSGGGMMSYYFVDAFPDRVSAVVINTGMMDESVMDPSFPKSKLAVLLASPTDFRWQEMHRDRDFLRSQGWTVDWIEFAGGHTFAPPDIYDQAAQWLDEYLPKP